VPLAFIPLPVHKLNRILVAYARLVQRQDHLDILAQSAPGRNLGQADPDDALSALNRWGGCLASILRNSSVSRSIPASHTCRVIQDVVGVFMPEV
jgi:hypothetical protein